MKVPRLSLFVCGLAVASFADLPSGYEPLSYIQGQIQDGKGAWILTSLTPACTDRVELDVAFVQTDITQTLYCSRGTTTSSDSFTGFLVAKSSLRADRNQGNVSAAFLPEENTRYRITADGSTLDYKVEEVDGSVKRTKIMPNGTFTPGSPFTLFASHVAGTRVTASTSMSNYGTQKLYSFKVSSAEGTLRFDGVPALRTSDEACGLYDTVGGGFYASASEVPFLSNREVAEASVTTDEDGNVVIDVPGSTSYTLTDDDVATINGCRNKLIKRGGGDVNMKAVPSFAGDIRIEAGYYVITDTNCCGVTTGGTIEILNGGGLRFYSQTAKTLVGKSVYLEGSGPGDKGVIDAKKTAWNSIDSCKFYLTGDARISQQNRLDYYTSFDTRGYEVTFIGETHAGVGGSYFTNSTDTASRVTVSGNLVMVGQHSGDCFKGSPDNRLCLTNKAWYYVKDWAIGNGWTTVFQDGSSVNSDTVVSSNEILTGCLTGPMEFSGTVSFTDRKTNSVVTLAGPIRGDGVWKVGPGWLNLASTNNTYSGKVVVTSREGEGIRRAGVRLCKSSAFNPSSVVLTNAEFAVKDSIPAAVPNLVVGGNGTSALTGGLLTVPRLQCPGLVKDGSGELRISAAVDFTGRVEIGAGTVSLGDAVPYVGNPGLMGDVVYPEAMCWSFTSPTSGDLTPTYTTWYPHGLDHLTDRSTTRKRCHFARGYIWNRTGDEAAWSFKANYNDRIWLWIDGKKVYANVAVYDLVDKRVATITVTPGPHEFALCTTANEGSTGPSGLGGVYTVLGVDWQGRGETADSYYEPLIDPGDGSVFTVDDSETSSTIPWKPDFADVRFAPGTIFDLKGHSLAVAGFEGMPRVINCGGLTIKDKFVVRATDLAGESVPKLSVAGTLAFAEGCLLDVADFDRASRAVRARLIRGVCVASATSVSGTLRQSEAARAAHFHVTLSGNDVILSCANGLSVIVR